MREDINKAKRIQIVRVGHLLCSSVVKGLIYF